MSTPSFPAPRPFPYPQMIAFPSISAAQMLPLKSSAPQPFTIYLCVQRMANVTWIALINSNSVWLSPLLISSLCLVYSVSSSIPTQFAVGVLSWSQFNCPFFSALVRVCVSCLAPLWPFLLPLSAPCPGFVRLCVSFCRPCPGLCIHAWSPWGPFCLHAVPKQ